MGPLIPTTETLSGNIERVTFHNPDNGFCVLKVSVKGRRDLTAVVGHIARAVPGEHIEATGQWTVDKRHGPQFRADAIHTAHPATPEGIERYLASGQVKGVGRSLASLLVEAFGTEVFQIIENHPERLRELPGIGRARQRTIAESWNEQRAVHKVMVFLHEHGLGAARAVRVYKAYGDDAIAVVKENPYRLAQDIRGIGFKAADALAGHLGVDPQSLMRARAGIGHVLQELTTEGHCAFPEKDLILKATELLGIASDVVSTALDDEIEAGRLVRQEIEKDTWIYLSSLYKAEVQLAASIRILLDGDHPLPEIKIDKALAWVERRIRLKLADAQKEAIKLASRHKVLIITGGPGVGKTTIVDGILKIFAAKGLKCLLCAPTGRAAKRLSEATRRGAKTIHRLLEFDPNEFEFMRNAAHPLKSDLVLIDEFSMVDLPLASAVMEAVPPNAAVILVGDVDQLPSVGPGNVLGNLIASGVVPTVRLTEIFRQAAQSRIVRAAYEVNNGKIPDLRTKDTQGDFFFVDAEDPETAADLLVRIVTERIPEHFQFDPLREVQVLTPMHRGVLGARNLNEVLQRKLNPAHPTRAAIERFGHTYRVGDKVLQIVNDYDKEVFNGDLGLILEIDSHESKVNVNFDGRAVSYAYTDLDELVPAYAMTIHKSQGSEFPAVVLPVHTQHFTMLQRNLLYTAITRGKRLVVLIGTERAINIAVQRAHSRRRYSGLRYRLAPRGGNEP